MNDFFYISQNSGIIIKELVAVSGYSDGYIIKILTSLKEKNVIERQVGNVCRHRTLHRPGISEQRNPIAIGTIYDELKT